MSQDKQITTVDQLEQALKAGLPQDEILKRIDFCKAQTFPIVQYLLKETLSYHRLIYDLDFLSNILRGRYDGECNRTEPAAIS